MMRYLPWMSLILTSWQQRIVNANTPVGGKLHWALDTWVRNTCLCRKWRTIVTFILWEGKLVWALCSAVFYLAYHQPPLEDTNRHHEIWLYAQDKPKSLGGCFFVGTQSPWLWMIFPRNTGLSVKEWSLVRKSGGLVLQNRSSAMVRATLLYFQLHGVKVARQVEVNL